MTIKKKPKPHEIFIQCRRHINYRGWIGTEFMVRGKTWRRQPIRRFLQEASVTEPVIITIIEGLALTRLPFMVRVSLNEQSDYPSFMHFKNIGPMQQSFAVDLTDFFREHAPGPQEVAAKITQVLIDRLRDRIKDIDRERSWLSRTLDEITYYNERRS